MQDPEYPPIFRQACRIETWPEVREADDVRRHDFDDLRVVLLREQATILGVLDGLIKADLPVLPSRQIESDNVRVLACRF